MTFIAHGSWEILQIVNQLGRRSQRLQNHGHYVLEPAQTVDVFELQLPVVNTVHGHMFRSPISKAVDEVPDLKLTILSGARNLPIERSIVEVTGSELALALERAFPAMRPWPEGHAKRQHERLAAGKRFTTALESLERLERDLS